MNTTTCWVTHRFVGFHGWPDAPDGRAYLRDRHRHVFHVRASVDVAHGDREVEFHDLLEVVQQACVVLGGPSVMLRARELGSLSCEQIAGQIGLVVLGEWPGRTVTVDVSEDAENGATVVLAPDS